MTGRRRPHVILRYDLRSPAFGTPHVELLSTALELAAYVEGHGFERVQVSEHHHAEDGYIPSVVVVASGLAARTSTIGIRLSALIASLHDPVRMAEDLAMLDVLANGRLEITVGAGYREVEFAMLDRDFAGRWKNMHRAIPFWKTAWRGEPTEFDGRPVLIRPTPVRPGGPPVLLGGSTAKAARFAAQLADGFDPATPEIAPLYLDACAELGVEPGDCRGKVGPFFLHVSDDPERDRDRLARYVQHEMQQYASWAADTSVIGGTPDIPLESVWDVGSHRVLTVDETVELLAGLDPNGVFSLHPLSGGLPPELAWESVTRFCEQVLPQLEAPEPYRSPVMR